MCERRLSARVFVPPHARQQWFHLVSNRMQRPHHESVLLEAVPAPATGYGGLQQLELHVTWRHADVAANHDVKVLERDAAQVLLLQAAEEVEGGAKLDVLQLQLG